MINLKANFVPSRNLWIALGLLAAGLIATALAVLYIKANVEAAAQREFDFTCNEIEINIINRLSDSAQILHSGAALFDASGMVTREQWRIFTQRLQIEQQLRGIQGIGFSLLIPPGQLTEHIDSIRGEGFPEYQVTPAGERETYSAIIYLEPFAGRNLRAFGYDMFSEPVRRAAMELARDGNIAALSGKVILVQETGQDVQAGALMYVPVYRRGLPIDTVEQRRAAIMGWVYSPYRMTDLMRGVLTDWEAKEQDRQIYLQVYDGDVISTDTLLYDSQSEADKSPVSSAWITRQTTKVDFGGRRWTLRFTQLGGLASMADYSTVWLVLFGGTIISLLLFWLILSLLNTRVNARRMADKLTSELRESESHYHLLADHMTDVVWLMDLNLNLLYISPSWEKIMGYSLAELQQLPFDQLLTPASVKLARELFTAEMPKALADPTYSPVITREFEFYKRDGSLCSVESKLIMIRDENGNPTSILGQDRDITERRLAELRYRSLFNQTHDAIFILNLEGRHIMVNQRACDMLGYTLDELKQLSVDDTSAQLEESRQVIERLLRGELVPLYERIFRRKDGSLLPIEINVELVRDANGKPLHIQSMVRDISERKQAEEKLRESEARLELFFTQSLDGFFFMMLDEPVRWDDSVDKDKALDYVFAHQRFTKVNGGMLAQYRVAREQYLGLTPNDLFAHDIEYGKRVWRELFDKGCLHIDTDERKFDGAQMWIEGDYICMYDNEGRIIGHFGIQREITERKRAEEQISQLSNELQVTLDTVTAGISHLKNRRVEWANAAHDEMFGYAVGETRGMETSVFYPEHTSFEQLGQAAYPQLMAGKTYSAEMEMRKRDGTRFWCNLTGRIVNVEKPDEGSIWMLYDISQRKQMEDTLSRAKEALEQALIREQKLARTDVLTGVNSRGYLFELAVHEFDVAMRYCSPLCMLMIDIDDFKQINDTFGHAIGDQAIQHISKIIRAEIRSADIIGRYGAGDEFIILLPQTSAQEALPFAERIHASVAAMHLETDKGVLTLAVSIGIAQTIHAAAQTDTVENLLLRADQAMYAAKQAGKNCTVVGE